VQKAVDASLGCIERYVTHVGIAPRVILVVSSEGSDETVKTLDDVLQRPRSFRADILVRV
jgi:hypothetical protein